MGMSKEDVLNAIAEMSVMEVVELIADMEEKFGVSAAAASQLLQQLGQREAMLARVARRKSQSLTWC